MLRWGIIGAGHIARELADGINASATGELTAIASRDRAKAEAFGDEYAVPRRYGSYQALPDDPGIDAVYIATPHPMHAEWAIKAAEAGKHMLVEKPLAVNAADARAMIDHAEKHDVFLMEALGPSLTRWNSRGWPICAKPGSMPMRRRCCDSTMTSSRRCPAGWGCA